MSGRFTQEQLQDMNVSQLRRVAKPLGLTIGGNVRLDATRLQWVENILNRYAALDAQEARVDAVDDAGNGNDPPAVGPSGIDDLTPAVLDDAQILVTDKTQEAEPTGDILSGTDDDVRGPSKNATANLQPPVEQSEDAPGFCVIELQHDSDCEEMIPERVEGTEFVIAVCQGRCRKPEALWRNMEKHDGQQRAVKKEQVPSSGIESAEPELLPKEKDWQRLLRETKVFYAEADADVTAMRENASFHCEQCKSAFLDESRLERHNSRHRQYPEGARNVKGVKSGDREGESTIESVHRKFAEARMQLMISNVLPRAISVIVNHKDDKCVYFLLFHPERIHDMWSFWRSVFYIGEGDYTRPYTHIWGGVIYRDAPGYTAYEQEKLFAYCFNNGYHVGIFRAFDCISKEQAQQIEATLFQFLQNIVIYQEEGYVTPEHYGVPEMLWLRQHCYRLFRGWSKELLETFTSKDGFLARVERVPSKQ